MAIFRSRRVKTKYAKLKKKNIEIAKKSVLALKKKNWYMANTLMSFDMQEKSCSYLTFNQNKFQFTKRKGISFVRSSQPFFSNAVNLMFPTTVLSINILFLNTIEDILVLKTKNKIPNGFLFFVVSLELFFSQLRFFSEQFNCTYIFLSANKFSSEKKPLGGNSLFVLFVPDSNNKETFMSKAVEFLQEKNFLIDYMEFFIWLGFFF